MSKPKRKPISDATAAPPIIMPSRDNVVTFAAEETPAPRQEPQRRSRGDTVRHSYHTSLYLPEGAQFALREIALAHRKAKPHDVLLEAMAELFERNGKIDLAEECRGRITASRDRVTK